MSEHHEFKPPRFNFGKDSFGPEGNDDKFRNRRGRYDFWFKKLPDDFQFGNPPIFDPGILQRHIGKYKEQAREIPKSRALVPYTGASNPGDLLHDIFAEPSADQQERAQKLAKQKEQIDDLLHQAAVYRAPFEYASTRAAQQIMRLLGPRKQTEHKQQHESPKEEATSQKEAPVQPSSEMPEAAKDITKITRRMSRLLHPDKPDTILQEEFSNEELVQSFTRIQDISSAKDELLRMGRDQKSYQGILENLQDEFLAIMPRYYKRYITSQLDEGKTLSEILTDPTIREDLENIRLFQILKAERDKKKDLSAQVTLAEQAYKLLSKHKDMTQRADGLAMLNAAMGEVLNMYGTDEDSFVGHTLRQIAGKLVALGLLSGQDVAKQNLQFGTTTDPEIAAQDELLNQQIAQMPELLVNVVRALQANFFMKRIKFNRASDVLNTLLDATAPEFQKFSELLNADRYHVALQKVIEQVLVEQKKIAGVHVERVSEGKWGPYRITIHNENWDSPVSITQMYVYIDGEWWYHTSRSRRVELGDGMSNFMYEAEPISGIKYKLRHDEPNAKKTKHQEEAEKNGFHKASVDQIKTLMQRIQNAQPLTEV